MIAASVGQYEYARVASVAGTTLTLTAALRNTYATDTTSRAQVVRVQQYTAVTVSADWGDLSAATETDDWLTLT